MINYDYSNREFTCECGYIWPCENGMSRCVCASAGRARERRRGGLPGLRQRTAQSKGLLASLNCDLNHFKEDLFATQIY